MIGAVSLWLSLEDLRMGHSNLILAQDLGSGGCGAPLCVLRLLLPPRSAVVGGGVEQTIFGDLKISLTTTTATAAKSQKNLRVP
jgi:hypothetical protein